MSSGSSSKHPPWARPVLSSQLASYAKRSLGRILSWLSDPKHLSVARKKVSRLHGGLKGQAVGLNKMPL